MNLFKHLPKVAVFSALALYGFTTASPAHAAATVPTQTLQTTCVGAAGGDDCVDELGHISASVVGTLSINEIQALRFGNMAVTCANPCAGDASFSMDPNGVRSTPAGTDVITLLYGADNGGNNGAGTDNETGSQGPGRLRVTGGPEGGATQVYISFADSDGNPVDYAGEDFYGTNHVVLNGPGGTSTFLVDDFTMRCEGTGILNDDATAPDNDPLAGGTNNNDGLSYHDIYGHFCNLDDDTAGAGEVIIAVGATLHTDTSSVTGYAAGKYTGTYNVMVSY
jgi:hypothetical protein